MNNNNDNNKFTFTNKEEYLAYRQAWKAEYKELSNTIREIKWARKFMNKTCNKTIKELGGNRNGKWCEYYNMVNKTLEEEKRFQSISKLVKHDLWSDKHKNIATQLLEELKLAKIEAQRQYQEQHQTTTV
jgi:hypothetical protein